MRRTVFYSWQSDLPSSGNRNLIERALTGAIRAIGRDKEADVEPVLDRDTVKLAGSPDIAKSILDKIALADVFVADVSIISTESQRPAPNPNVLVELGYAIATLGWDRVILVQNIAYGTPESLPFDLRGHRVVVYKFLEVDAKAEERGLLQGRLETALRTALDAGSASSLPTGPDANLWWGKWQRRGVQATDGDLFIREVGPNGFLFELNVIHGAHSGSLTRYARLTAPDRAAA